MVIATTPDRAHCRARRVVGLSDPFTALASAVGPSEAVESDYERQRVSIRGAAAQKHRITLAPFVAWIVTLTATWMFFGRSLA